MKSNFPKVKFYCSRWGHEQMPWNDFAKKVTKNRFSGVEVIALRYPEQTVEMLNAIEKAGLEYNLIYTEKRADADVNRYLDLLEKGLTEIAEKYRNDRIEPRFLICQTGREYYTKEQMKACFEVCDFVHRKTGLNIIQETHRYRWSFAVHIVEEYLQTFPNLKLALDLSHWFCVSESYLHDQSAAVISAMEKTVHLHARIGHTQGPQVIDPRSPDNAVALENHIKWWDLWMEIMSRNGVQECSITPEFGPYPYMSLDPRLQQPMANLWTINNWMRDFLEERYTKRHSGFPTIIQS